MAYEKLKNQKKKWKLGLLNEQLIETLAYDFICPILQKDCTIFTKPRENN